MSKYKTWAIHVGRDQSQRDEWRASVNERYGEQPEEVNEHIAWGETPGIAVDRLFESLRESKGL